MMTASKISVLLVLASVSALVATTFAAVQAPVPSGPASMRSTNQGVFTAEQVEAGKVTFKDICSDCHNPEYFTGEQFMAQWANKPLFDLYQMVSVSMPSEEPGSLTKEQYAGVIALLLQWNGVPAGTAKLEATDEAMSAIQFDFPKPTGK